MAFSDIIVYINLVLYPITLFVNYYFSDDQSEVSDANDTPITPKGVAFSIWGVIYIFLFFFVVVECCYPAGTILVDSKYTTHFRILVLISFLCNMGWMLTFSFVGVVAAFIPIFILWLCLGPLWLRAVYVRETQEFNIIRYICSALPLTLYFAWITVANTLSVGIIYQTWNDDQMLSWTVSAVALTFVMVVAICLIVYFNEFAGGLVAIWAFYWIARKEPEKTDDPARDEQVSHAAALGTAVLVCIFIIHAIFVVARKFSHHHKKETRSPTDFPLSPEEGSLRTNLIKN